jgi:HEAT repeat protein
MRKSLQASSLALALILAISMSLPVQAETLASGSARVPFMPQTDGYTMMSWLNSLSIVEQLQTIHRLGQSTSPDALMGLVSALNSPYPLARRKASRSLLEKARASAEEDQKLLAVNLNEAMESGDPIVQKNIVRLMAEMKIPEAQDVLRHFFTGAGKDAQLSAVDALSQDDYRRQDTLSLITRFSPYNEVRQAAANTLK